MSTTHLWPLSPPQRFNICDCINPPDGIDVNNNEILQTITLPQSNVLIMLTPARVLVYNLKPLALVASHERTGESIVEFGLNKSIKSSITLDHIVEGLISEDQLYDSAWNQGKLVFYVTTEKNFLLTYQILKNSTNLATFKEYGIPVVNLEKMNEDLDHEYDDAMDDDTLTVYEKNKSSRIIQNGYAITKEKGFLQFLSTAQENLDELPVKKLELRLKVVLKVDYQILDLFAFKRLSEVEDNRAEESLLVLFPHGLQLLTLVDFRLKSTSLVEISHGKRICINEGYLLVLAQDMTSDNHSILVNHINIAQRRIKTVLLENQSTLLNCYNQKEKIALAYNDSISYYNPKTQEIIYRFKLPYQVKYCDILKDGIILVVSEKNYLSFFSEMGNLLFSNFSEEDIPSNFVPLDYSHFTFVHMTLIATSRSGEYEIWNLWEEPKRTYSDTRSFSSYVLQNSNNDIALYTPVGDSSICHDNLQFIKLPTRTINNCISQIKVNSNLKMMAIYVSNKAILLLHNLETSTWYSFTDIIILDCHWVGNSYLVCQIKGDDGSVRLNCFHLRLQGIDTSDIFKYSIWSYDLPGDVEILSLNVNTFYKYRSLKLKVKDNEYMEKYGEKYFRTSEVVAITKKHIIRFAIISNVHPTGANTIKKFHEHTKLIIPDHVQAQKIEWAMHFRDGLILFWENKLVKVTNIESSEWEIEVMLENIERIVDVFMDEIFVVCENREIFCNLDNLWDKKPALLSVPLEDDCYPISVSSHTATVLGLKCIFHGSYSKFVIKHQIYLDVLILNKMEQKVSPEQIMDEYRSVRYFNFALEKILSTKILENQPLDDIIQLIKLCDIPQNYEGSLTNSHSDMLEIVSNCLRKTEIKHWNLLFSNLEMTPRELLARCLEGNEAKILGILLLVFLNYDAELVDDLRGNEVDRDEKEQQGQDSSSSPNPDSSVADLIRDQEMMLRVLRLLVTSAANTTDSAKAADSWDMCFQLMRLLKELDKENNTQLVQKALDMFS